MTKFKPGQILISDTQIFRVVEVGQKIELEIWDGGGWTEYGQVRAETLAGMQVFEEAKAHPMSINNLGGLADCD